MAPVDGPDWWRAVEPAQPADAEPSPAPRDEDCIPGFMGGPDRGLAREQWLAQFREQSERARRERFGVGLGESVPASSGVPPNTGMQRGAGQRERERQQRETRRFRATLAVAVLSLLIAVASLVVTLVHDPGPAPAPASPAVTVAPAFPR